MLVRDATTDDLEHILDLAQAKRAQYEQYSPVFWRPAKGAREAQRSYFNTLVSSSDAICLVHETNGLVDGFIIASLVSAPPVYDPGGKVCAIDDFVVADPSTWSTTGAALREEAERRAQTAGAVLSVTVCGQQDEAKRQALLDAGGHVASEWFVRTIAPQD